MDRYHRELPAAAQPMAGGDQALTIRVVSNVANDEAGLATLRSHAPAQHKRSWSPTLVAATYHPSRVERPIDSDGWSTAAIGCVPVCAHQVLMAGSASTNRNAATILPRTGLHPVL